ncbi:MAG: SDR family NAD(P)-dependent oxidoreductase [Candidatus Accumulibacter sp.]|nr:SDR family NAD(P)-dependent oxidoreductase [Accumulibacter sp.]MBO3711846.1 SDR family NAD(P)-dependent oxidoreductase [Accumulibacter sp.]
MPRPAPSRVCGQRCALRADGHRPTRHRTRQPQPWHKAAAVVGEIVICGGGVEAVIFAGAEREPTATALSDLVAADPIQILVNNAGMDADAVFPAMSGEHWDNVIDVAVIAFLNVTRPLIPLMIRRR